MNNNINVIEHTLYPYQERDMNKLIEVLNEHRKVCFQAITSFGKTICFSTLAKWYKYLYNKKILVICHREELIEQSASEFIRMGMTVEKILPKTKRLHGYADVYIAMERTLTNRMNKDKYFIPDVGMVIIDECHIGNFFPHIERFKTQKIIGFTATPLLNDRVTYWKCPRCKSTSDFVDYCCGMEMEEWGKPRTLSMYFDEIVIGASPSELIEFGSIVKEINFIEDVDRLEDLKTDSTGEYTTESQNKVFGTKESVISCLLNYEKYCKGEKTMIFNPSAKVNKMLYDEFVENGYTNVKIYDSVNEKDGSRKELVKWFEETPDACLLNVSIFTTGFSVKSVQNIILNRSIGSLPLYIQIVGRGARSCSTIYKPNFKVLDLGGNVQRHNRWSDDNRDWRRMFFEGNSKDKAKVEAPLSVQECRSCSMLFSRSESICPNCGFEVPTKPKKEVVYNETVLVPIDKIPLPNGKKIIEYTLSRGEGKAFAFKVLTEQIIDLFRFNLVSKAQYLNNKKDGRLSKRLSDIIRPVYFAFLNQPEFKEGANRTLKWTVKKIEEKLDKYYNID